MHTDILQHTLSNTCVCVPHFRKNIFLHCKSLSGEADKRWDDTHHIDTVRENRRSGDLKRKCCFIHLIVCLPDIFFLFSTAKLETTKQTLLVFSLILSSVCIFSIFYLYPSPFNVFLLSAHASFQSFFFWPCYIMKFNGNFGFVLSVFFLL